MLDRESTSPGTVAEDGWAYDPATRLLAIGAEPCPACRDNRPPVPAGRRQTFGWTACRTCHGTGTDRAETCPVCVYHRDPHTRHGMADGYRPGLVPDYPHPIDAGVCPACRGRVTVGPDPDTTTSAVLPARLWSEVLAGLPVTVIASTQPLSTVEAGLGYLTIDIPELAARALWITSDGGRTWNTLRAARTAGDLDPAVENLAAQVRAEITTRLRRVSDVCLHRHDPLRWRVATRVTVVVSPDGVRVLLVDDRRTQPTGGGA